MSERQDFVQIEPAKLFGCAEAIERHAAQIEQHLQRTMSTINTLSQSGQFKGMSARALLWSYQQQKSAFLLWPQRLQVYAARLRAASEAMRLADARSAISFTSRIGTIPQAIGLEYDRGYQRLITLEKKLADAQSAYDKTTMSLALQQVHLAELQLKLADYNEISGDDIREYIQDAGEYVIGFLGGKAALEKEIESLQASISAQEVNLKWIADEVVHASAEADTASADIQTRIQNVDGHKILFAQKMADKPIAEKGYCLRFVQRWRPDIPTIHKSAADLITSEMDSIAPYRYRLDESSNLQSRIRPGDLVVWDRTQADPNHGHVAIVLQVHNDSVIVKEASWGNEIDTWRPIPRATLQTLTFVGQPDLAD